MEEQNISPEEINSPKETAAEPASAEATAGEDELLKFQKERDEYLDGWKRAKAELINYKREDAQRFEAVLKMANEGLIRRLLLVLDSFDLGLSSLEKDGPAQKGMYLIRSQLKDILKSCGLEEIASSVGQLFNPAVAESVEEVESDEPSGTVVEEVEKGYLLNGRIVRPARVKISK